MNVEYHRNFEKDVDKLSPIAKKVVADVVKEIKTAATLRDIQHCKKLEGVTDAYRIKCGGYRILFLFTIKNNIIYLRRVIPRGGAYKKHIIQKYVP